MFPKTPLRRLPDTVYVLLFETIERNHLISFINFTGKHISTSPSRSWRKRRLVRNLENCRIVLNFRICFQKAVALLACRTPLLSFAIRSTLAMHGPAFTSRRCLLLGGHFDGGISSHVSLNTSRVGLKLTPSSKRINIVSCLLSFTIVQHDFFSKVKRAHGKREELFVIDSFAFFMAFYEKKTFLLLYDLQTCRDDEADT
jgi:hypothetical protein